MNHFPKEPVFTIAKTARSLDSPPCFLFYHPEWDDNMLSDILKNRRTRRFLGNPVVILKPSTYSHVIIASLLCDIGIMALNCSEVTIGNTRQGRFQTIQLDNNFNNCNFPGKYAMNCAECLSVHTKTKPQCEIAQVTGRFKVFSEGCQTLYHSRQLKSRKTMIEDFVYIGPGLTAKPFSPALREPQHHHFGYVEYNTEMRKDASQERVRFEQFQKEVCPQCFVLKSCEQPRYCRGHYEGTQEQIARQIIKQVKIPFTRRQLFSLAANSGELDKRYNRKFYFATFYLSYASQSPELKFGLRRIHDPHEIVGFKNYDEALNFIHNNKKYGRTEKDLGARKLTTRKTATLVELAAIEQSPTYRHGWGSTTYDVAGITFTPDSQRFEQHYYWRSKRKSLPWTLGVRDLHSIFEHYQAFNFASRKRHELSKCRW